MLREVRQKAGITQTELGRLVGRNQPYIAKVERRSRRIDPIEMVVWLRACKADPKVFFDRLLRL